MEYLFRRERKVDLEKALNISNYPITDFHTEKYIQKTEKRK